MSARHIWAKGPGKIGSGPWSRKSCSVPAGLKELSSWVGPIETDETSTPQKLSSADELTTSRSHPPYSATYLVQTHLQMHLGKRLYKTETLAEETGVDVEENNKYFYWKKFLYSRVPIYACSNYAIPRLCERQ